MTIGTIDWPEEPKMAIELYLNFVIRIIKENKWRKVMVLKSFKIT